MKKFYIYLFALLLSSTPAFSGWFFGKDKDSEKKEHHLNKGVIEGDWKMVKGKVKTKWGKLTNDDLIWIDGQADRLIGKIQKHYNLTKEEAEEEYREWAAKQ